MLADGIVVGRIMNAAASPVGSPWLWTLAFGHHEDRTQTHGYAATREAAMSAFAKGWWRGSQTSGPPVRVRRASILTKQPALVCARPFYGWETRTWPTMTSPGKT